MLSSSLLVLWRLKNQPAQCAGARCHQQGRVEHLHAQDHAADACSARPAHKGHCHASGSPILSGCIVFRVLWVGHSTERQNFAGSLESFFSAMALRSTVLLKRVWPDTQGTMWVQSEQRVRPVIGELKPLLLLQDCLMIASQMGRCIVALCITPCRKCMP